MTGNLKVAHSIILSNQKIKTDITRIDRRLNICHLISGDLWAGAEAMTLHLLKGLLRFDDLQLSAILFNEGKLAQKVRELNIPVVVVNETEIPFLKTFLIAKKVLNQLRPNIIHSHRYKENILAYLLSKTQKSTSLIETQHGMPEMYENGTEKSSIQHRIVSKLNFFILSKCFQNIVAVSKDIQEIFINQYDFSRDKVKVIYNGINIPEDITPLPQKDSFIIGSSGRLFPVKDYSLMVEVAREISRQNSDIRFELAGDGPESGKLERLIEKYGLQRTFATRGFLDHVSVFYRRLDLYLNTSLHEGIPMSVLEAMSFSIPVVAPDVGGLREIIDDGVDGYLVGSRNPKDFAEKCLTLYKNRSLRKQMGSAARDKVLSKFSLENMVRQYYSLYVGN
jgi:glycosyltransferase involved in cell wall biosynthesis